MIGTGIVILNRKNNLVTAWKHLQLNNACLPHSWADSFHSCLNANQKLSQITCGIRNFFLISQHITRKRHAVWIKSTWLCTGHLDSVAAVTELHRCDSDDDEWKARLSSCCLLCNLRGVEGESTYTALWTIINVQFPLPWGLRGIPDSDNKETAKKLSFESTASWSALGSQIIINNIVIVTFTALCIHKYLREGILFFGVKINKQ